MDIELIGKLFLIIEDYLIKIGSILVYLWWFLLLVFIVKSFISKSKLDRKKRNIIAIKCIVGFIYGYSGLLVLNMLNKAVNNYTYFQWFSIHTLGIVLIIIYLGILLFYSGTFLIFSKKNVEYSWPLRFLNQQKGQHSENN